MSTEVAPVKGIILEFVCGADHYVRNIAMDGFSRQLDEIVKGLNSIKSPREDRSFAGVNFE